jgi:hypothetical protein
MMSPYFEYAFALGRWVTGKGFAQPSFSRRGCSLGFNKVRLPKDSASMLALPLLVDRNLS